MSDRAAALTYYSLLSLFPALLFGVAALGFFGRAGLISEAADYLLQAGAPRQTVDAVTTALESAQSQRSTAFTALIMALGTSLYGASGAFGAVGRALNVVWRVEEGRNFVRKKAHDLVWTAVLLVLVLITFVLIFVGGSVAQDLLGTIGLGERRRRRVADRALARGARVRDARLRDRVLRGAERRGAALPVHHPGRGRSAWSPGSSRPAASSSTSRTSRPTRRPTARSRPS